ncbi:uncharacterized protein [Onthophagus taurus]|uniref:uncharacterized protein n=1 Tax=Onthophagus taurus TaxID=166361 RepID=UPI000C20F415|nr:uncharacterized protein LOC111424650 [Onthophagus taurus]
MAILTTCCCWNNVRKGSFACGIYYMVYFTIFAAMTCSVLHQELLLLRNETSTKMESFLDPDMASITSTIFTGVIFGFSTLGIVTSILLLYGLYRNQRLLLIPWIFVIIGFLIVDLVHCFYMIVVNAINVNPATAMLVTIDFFLNSLNVYALLCVISQYQELKGGRGRAEDHANRIPSIHYSSQPTATTYLSTKKAMTYTEARPSPTQSPTGTGPHTSLGTEEPSPHILNRGPRKSVKFPDSPTYNGVQDDWSMMMINASLNHHITF